MTSPSKHSPDASKQSFFSIEYLQHLYLSPDGRLDRLSYYAGKSFLVFLIFCVFAITSLILPDAFFVVLFITLLPAFIGGILLDIQRLHDLGLNGALFLVKIIPLVGGLFALYMWFAPGNPGLNEYGAIHKSDKRKNQELFVVIFSLIILIIPTIWFHYMMASMPMMRPPMNF
ncbi:hypothetical protein COB57_05135 [Candidatus Peregrinibacteria bacterium]|nr:MAG: hypothetical protein COB57_05135 [Candidatus Peregrinibacteria bacterium]